MGETDIGALDETIRLPGKEALHLGFGDLDVLDHLPRLELTHNHLGAGVLAKVFEADAAGYQGGLEFLQGQVVALGDAGHGLGQGTVLDLDPEPRCLLELQALVEHPVQDLALQFGAGGQVGPLLAQLGQG